jgi:hypothetical protein
MDKIFFLLPIVQNFPCAHILFGSTDVEMIITRIFMPVVIYSLRYNILRSELLARILVNKKWQMTS